MAVRLFPPPPREALDSARRIATLEVEKVHGGVMAEGTGMAGNVGNALRVLFWRVMLRLRGGRLGRRCRIEPGVCLASKPGNPVIVGDEVHLGRGAILSTARTGRVVVEDGASVGAGAVVTSDAEIRIGPGAVIGSHADIVDFNHTFERLEELVEFQPLEARPIRIGARARLGERAKVLCGVTVGDGAEVEAGSVVTRDIPAGARAGGVPARVHSAAPPGGQ
ncbi:MAG TPA: acyltransferase [Phycisphaerae bacterium]|nr:acyltransferase [Phycisphaerae bacterium]